jgi:hypothetical protein
MSGDIQVKLPVAALVLAVLVLSLLLNVWSLSRGPQFLTVSVPSGSGMNATLPNGERNPLAHVPSGPRDAVGMPDATGGTGR